MKRVNVLNVSAYICVCTIGLMSCHAQSNQKEPKSPFEFRGIYSPTNALESTRDFYGTQHVDYDWGLWGHNLHKALGENPDNSVLATIDGKKDKEQYCFSSDLMYDKLVEYIIDNFGDGEQPGSSTRISIMPRDNKKSCTCKKCIAAGNTKTNATPAVTNMMRRLAERFPKHQFFTSAYHSTRIAPKDTLPSNVGVIISAIDLPMRVAFSENQGYRTFVNMVKEWKEKTSLIYIWDYARNFSDYLSPFPFLKVMQRRFQLYDRLGVKGIFLNGSGDDYATFDDMQTCILCKMMYDLALDVDAEVRKYYQENYPKTGKLIADYYLKLERKVDESNHIIPLYGSIEEEVESYLNVKNFEEFRNQLENAAQDVTGIEKEKLNYMLTALCFTQLQIMAMQNKENDPQIKTELIERLKGHKELKGMNNYGETDADIDAYLKKFENN